MPSELEELVEFLHHGNTQIRQIAAEHLVPYSSTNHALFKRNQLEPVRDLKLLIRDYTPIATNALTTLTNLSSSGDRELLWALSRDGVFVEALLAKLVDVADSNADLCCGLLANLLKDDELARSLETLDRAVPPRKKVKVQTAGEESRTVEVEVTTTSRALSQLMDCFVRGSEYTLNPAATFDYLAYVFADITKFAEGRKYLLTKQDYDGVVPVTKLLVFTEHSSLTRRKGVASTIKNICFETDTDTHARLLADDSTADTDTNGIGVLPYVLLPIAGPEELDEKDTENMLPELQMLPADKKRESDCDVITTHLETLLLLTSTRPGRTRLRDVSVYPIVRELHLAVEDEGVREMCERLVNVLMRDEDEREARIDQEKEKEKELGEDHRIEEIF